MEYLPQVGVGVWETGTEKCFQGHRNKCHQLGWLRTGVCFLSHGAGLEVLGEFSRPVADSGVASSLGLVVSPCASSVTGISIFLHMVLS